MAPEPRRWTTQVLVPEMWASLAIIAMWLVVLFDALWGPDFTSTTATGSTTIPSAIVIAFFAMFGTIAVARRGFDHRD